MPWELRSQLYRPFYDELHTLIYADDTSLGLWKTKLKEWEREFYNSPIFNNQLYLQWHNLEDKINSTNPDLWSFNQEVSAYIIDKKRPFSIFNSSGYVSLFQDDLLCDLVFIDFCINTLKLNYPKPEWEALSSLLTNSSCLLMLKKICVVSDRPYLISHDISSEFNNSLLIKFTNDL
ncbi:hypothetical protein [Argonema antarcticum]|uniref:hypothetical protein n=1 Tax=Argonema antarcticum TaxID=2942763 RepID=UPI0020130E0F|nr:hypothetical protein [Argonema antarcticum]MCL1472891.1 hypothetical protein [Argonema antarcticum A004/B2]